MTRSVRPNITTGICVDRCVCTRRTFAELKVIADRSGLHLESLGDMTDAGRHCGMCRPYLRAMLESGTTVFDHLLKECPLPDSPTVLESRP